MALTPFATVQELAAYWRPLTSAETPRATSLLTSSSNRLRLTAEGSGINLDTKIVDNELYESVLKSVVLESVKRAMLTPIDQPPVDTWSQTAGPYSENYKYTNPSGDLWFKKAELRSLGFGGQRLSNISSSRTDIYGENEPLYDDIES